MRRTARLLRALPLLLLSPLLLLVSVAGIAFADLLWLIRRKRPTQPDTRPSTTAASVVIPNWNGRDLLEKYLPSVIAAIGSNPDNEIIVVDNGSEDDSADFVRLHFPAVKVLALEENLGFGGGSNAGFRAARNDVVVLLNSDMRVEPDFLQPLLEGFTDEKVFSVSCQIFFTDPLKKREETGLTQGWWENGALRVRHRIDNQVTGLFPCFYGGGGSCAYHRAKFLELGGFDPLLEPFYLEDTDIGYMAWKRGWKVLYQPRSVVYHEHRGTIGKLFADEYIQGVLKKNFVLFCWKNIHEWSRLWAHFIHTGAGAVVSLLFGDSPERANFRGLARALRQMPGAVRSRWLARDLAVVSDTEAFSRPLAGHYRDRFMTLPPDPNALSVLFVSPYPICPPVHGGAVFMYQTVKQLGALCDLHLLVLLDHARDLLAHDELTASSRSAEFLVRLTGRSAELASITPHAVREFQNDDLEWMIHRIIYLRNVDVLQLEYLPMGQYGRRFRQIATILFEHDIYFQSVGRFLRRPSSPITKIKAAFEYLRALNYELNLLPAFDRIQVCSTDNARYLASFLPSMEDRIDSGLRAGIDTSRYKFRTCGREPLTMLFLGSFRHLPNQEALTWFVRSVLPLVSREQPDSRLIVIGSDPPPRHSLPESAGRIEMRGFVEDVREPLSRYSVFVCPVLTGSGVRVKLLEAFAAGIPVVSTTLGAEGLAREDDRFCAIADKPEDFAARIIRLFQSPDEAQQMAERARAEVEAHWDMPDITRKLVASYRQTVREKRSEGRYSSPAGAEGRSP